MNTLAHSGPECGRKGATNLLQHLSLLLFRLLLGFKCLAKRLEALLQPVELLLFRLLGLSLCFFKLCAHAFGILLLLAEQSLLLFDASFELLNFLGRGRGCLRQARASLQSLHLFLLGSLHCCQRCTLQKVGGGLSGYR